ncbi:MAG: hypothetical protein ABIT01_05090 [Thermoanaerobaculia bacterium]
MRHILVSSRRPGLVSELRELSGDGATFLVEHGVDETLERLGRSARIDAVITDDIEIETAIRDEIPGMIPIYRALSDEEAASIWAGASALLAS